MRYLKYTRRSSSPLAVALAAFLMIGMPVAAWITHVIHTITHEMWILLVVGAFAFPVGIIHGFMIWLGVA